MNRLIINQTLIKRFFYRGEPRDYCAKRIYEETVLGNFNTDTLSMLSGSYFETLCLGSGIQGTKTDDLPRKKLTAKDILSGKTIGDKTIAHRRIDKQHMIFEKTKTKYMIAVEKDFNTQVRVFKKFSQNDNIVLRGEFDIFPTPIALPSRGLRLALIDLKLTGRFTDFGEYCWATPHALDNTQGYMYHELARDIDIDFNIEMDPETKLKDLLTDAIKNKLEENDILFFYWVFNYRETELKNKFIEVPWTPTIRATLYESIRKTVEEYNKNERQGWRTNSSKYNCSNCPILNCRDRHADDSLVDNNEQFTSI